MSYALAVRPRAIATQLFEYWWDIWCEKWGKRGAKAFSKAFKREYYQALNGRIDDAQFERAAKQIFTSGKYFPTDATTVVRIGHGVQGAA